MAIDGCPITPGINLQLDERPGIWSKDREVHYDQRLVKFLRQCAKDAGTELQVAAYDSTASDASRVYATGAAPRVAVCGVVRENSHGFEVASKSAFANLLKILVKFIQSSPSIVFRFIWVVIMVFCCHSSFEAQVHRIDEKFPVQAEIFVDEPFKGCEGIAFNGEGDLFVTANKALWKI